MPNEDTKEVDKFFEDLPQVDDTPADIFATEDVKEPAPEKDEEPAPHKNRKHKRWELDLMEREQRIKEKEIELAQKATQTPQDTSTPTEWLALYGDTPDAHKAWKMQEAYLLRYKEDAKKEALSELTKQREQEVQEQRDYENYIDSQLESLEDTHNVDLTSDAPVARKARKELLALVQKLSPKNESGEITGFADFSNTWEIYKNMQKPSNVQQKKEIAAQTMSKSGAVDTKAVQQDAELAYLRSIGINV